jgi:hypothetical protein
MFHFDSQDDHDYDPDRSCFECSRPIAYGARCTRCWMLDEADLGGEG